MFYLRDKKTKMLMITVMTTTLTTNLSTNKCCANNRQAQQTHGVNFVTSWSSLKIFSPLERELIFQQHAKYFRARRVLVMKYRRNLYNPLYILLENDACIVKWSACMQTQQSNDTSITDALTGCCSRNNCTWWQVMKLVIAVITQRAASTQ